MTTNDDKARAVLQAGALLRQLKTLECSPLAVEQVRSTAQALLRHFPNKRDVRAATHAIHTLMGVHDDE